MTKKESLEYAKKRYPLDSYYICPWKNNVFKSKNDFRISDIEENRDVFEYSSYAFYKGVWAENCDQNGNIIPYIETEKTLELW